MQSGEAAIFRHSCLTIGGRLLIVAWNGGDVDATRTGCGVRWESSPHSRRLSDIRPSGAAYSSDSGSTLFEWCLANARPDADVRNFSDRTAIASLAKCITTSSFHGRCRDVKAKNPNGPNPFINNALWRQWLKDAHAGAVKYIADEKAKAQKGQTN